MDILQEEINRFIENMRKLGYPEEAEKIATNALAKIGNFIPQNLVSQAVRIQEIGKNRKNNFEINPNFVTKNKFINFSVKTQDRTPKEPTLPTENEVKALVMDLIPWRKGPFSIDSLKIDAEWDSSVKFNAIAEQIPADLSGQKILDIGSNNGYYLFRLLDRNPAMALGIEPYPRYFLQYLLLSMLINYRGLSTLPYKVADIDKFNNFFQIILYMGVIYHQRHPLNSLEIIYNALAKKGKIIIESIGINKKGSYAFFPPNRYAKMANVWFIPTKDCLFSWLKRSGFSEIEFLHSRRVTSKEQKVTSFTFPHSLADTLNPENPRVTIEGFPYPYRIAFSAKKP